MDFQPITSPADTIVAQPYPEKPPNELWEFIKNFLIEFTVLFCVLLVTIGTTIFLDIAAARTGEFTSKFIYLTIFQAFLFSFSFTVGLFLFKASYQSIFNLIKRLIPPAPDITAKTAQTKILDIFVLLASIIAFVPIRPVMQDMVARTDDFYVTARFVKYDFTFILGILLVASILTIILLYQFSVQKRNFLIYLFPIFIAVAFSALNYGPNFSARLFEARAAWKAGENQKLVDSAKKALESAKTDDEKAVSYYWIGVGYNLQERPQEAKENLLKGLELKPNDGIMYSALAHSYIRLKDYENATSTANKSISLAPDYPWGYMALSRIAWEHRDYAKARQMAEKAQQLDPESREIRDTLDRIIKFTPTK